MFDKISEWYNGKEVITEYDNEDQSVIILPSIHTEYHWSAKCVRAVIQFFCKHWQWIIGTIVAAVIGVLGLYLSFLALTKDTPIKEKPREPTRSHQNYKI